MSPREERDAAMRHEFEVGFNRLRLTQQALNRLTMRVSAGATNLVPGRSDRQIIRDAVAALYAARRHMDHLCLDLCEADEHWTGQGGPTPNDEDDMSTALLKCHDRAEQIWADLDASPSMRDDVAATYRSQAGY